MHPVLELLRSHVSVRSYTGAPIPDDAWTEILRAGQQASTDATGQLYAAVEVRDPGLRARFAPIAGGQPHVHEAARLLVVCLDTRRLRLLLERRGERYGMGPRVALLFGISDAAFFAQNVCVAAEALGYGVCFLGAVQNQAREVADLLHLPAGVVPLWGLTFGVPAHTTPPRPRLPLGLVLHVDRYLDPSDAQMEEAYRVMAAATRSGDWLNPIRKYFAMDGVMAGREDEFAALLAAQGLDPCDGRTV